MRASGILLPVASLPGPYGIGSLGKAAYQWIDFLQQAKQKYWQILPIGPTSYGDSPYQSFSAFAANPYFIDLDRLCSHGLLTREEIDAAQLDSFRQSIDYECQFHRRLPLLKKAAGRFRPAQNGYAEFVAENAFWLPDYALFMALKEENGQEAFKKWPRPLRMREAEAMQQARARCAEQIRCWQVLQYWFHEQWSALKQYANEHGVFIIGDIPIYVSPDSSDLWTQPSLFQTDQDGELTEVAGCPPDAFSADGQLWGNPLYRWEEHRRTGYQWWINRLRYAETVFDVVRIDHFRGFSGYYAVDAKAPTAADGRWRLGPGSSFVHCIRDALPEIRIIAEDLGYLTPDVHALLDESGFPGMKVLQFAFDSREESDYLPHNYPRNCVVYTGTHDNTTTEDWQHSAPAEDVRFAREYIHAGSHDFTRQFIRAAMASVGNTVIIPMQDWLELGAEARINTPGTLGGNWVWRMPPGADSAGLAQQIAGMTTLYGRA
ncbi:MAG: 4-alpha-glucanotransferase [Firmicutes bacterium]|nr:4-alpha-glucanotransferase [Bacillota bacterium]